MTPVTTYGRRQARLSLGLLLLVVLAVPAPVAPLALLGLGAGRTLLFGALATGRALAGSCTRSGTEAPGPETARSTRRAEVARRAARGAPWARRSSAKTTWPPRTTRRATRSCRARRTRAEATASGAWRATPITTRRARPGRLGLRLLDDDRTPLQDAPGELLDRSFGAVVGGGLHEGEPAWTAGFAIERNTDTPQLDLLAGERLPQLLLGDVVRKITNEKSGTHLFFWCLLACLVRGRSGLGLRRGG